MLSDSILSPSSKRQKIKRAIIDSSVIDSPYPPETIDGSGYGGIEHTVLCKMSDSIWKIALVISNRKDWYSKILDPVIVAKWRDEIAAKGKEFSIDVTYFDTALGLLRASGQGTKHSSLCNWENRCKECIEDFIQDEIRTGRKRESISEDEIWDNTPFDECEHIRCVCKAPDCTLGAYIVYEPEHAPKSLAVDLRDSLKKWVAELGTKTKVSWHPGSKELVADIVHPSMYCYVKGISILKSTGKPEMSDVHESLRYQWLPAEFDIGSDKKVTISSYINNLEMSTRNVEMVSQVFNTFVPSLERVIKTKLSGTRLQVIAKIAQILLTPDKPTYDGGAWHIEGMPYEHIAATAIYYVESQNITDSFLEFRKPTLFNENTLRYPQSDSMYTKHHYGLASHDDGKYNRFLGLIKCHEGAGVVFPNTIQHRVKEFRLLDKTKPATRTIIAFFVIDPKHRIVSTLDVEPQQKIFSEKDALYHQERLMYHRKYFVDTLNSVVFERPFSLCEH